MLPVYSRVSDQNLIRTHESKLIKPWTQLAKLVEVGKISDSRIGYQGINHQCTSINWSPQNSSCLNLSSVPNLRNIGENEQWRGCSLLLQRLKEERTKVPSENVHKHRERAPTIFQIEHVLTYPMLMIYGASVHCGLPVASPTKRLTRCYSDTAILPSSLNKRAIVRTLIDYGYSYQNLCHTLGILLELKNKSIGNLRLIHSVNGSILHYS